MTTAQAPTPAARPATPHPLPAARSADLLIAPLFLERVSSRRFLPAALPDDVLFQLFEAARWAPSASNRQPWRFIYAKRDTADWPRFIALLNEGNRGWAAQAAVIVFIVSQNLAERDGKLVPAQTHAFDAGAAWLSLALQASLLGLNTRAMGGIDRDGARVALEIPDDFSVNVAVAIGYRGGAVAGAETPTQRRPLQEIVAEGRFARS